MTNTPTAKRAEEEMEDLSELTDAQLDTEFDRLADLRDQCQHFMRQIRSEQEARMDREIEKLRAQLDDEDTP